MDTSMKVFCSDCEHHKVIHVVDVYSRSVCRHPNNTKISTYVVHGSVEQIVDIRTKNVNGDCEDFEKKRNILVRLFG